MLNIGARNAHEGQRTDEVSQALNKGINVFQGFRFLYLVVPDVKWCTTFMVMKTNTLFTSPDGSGNPPAPVPKLRDGTG